MRLEYHPQVAADLNSAAAYYDERQAGLSCPHQEAIMARLTLRLPESLHQALAHQADEEGVSLNQYLVYTLARTAAFEGVATQRASFEELRSRFSTEEAEGALAEVLAGRR